MDRDEAMKTIEDRLSYYRTQRAESPEVYQNYKEEILLTQVHQRLVIGKSLERAYGYASELYKSLEEESKFWECAGASPLNIGLEFDLKHALKMFEARYNRLKKKEEGLIEALERSFYGDKESDGEVDKETDKKFRRIVDGIFEEN